MIRTFANPTEQSETTGSSPAQTTTIPGRTAWDTFLSCIASLCMLKCMYQMGYTIKKSSEERHDILDAFISIDGIEKARKYLQFLINTRSAMKNGVYEKAVSKWQEDLDYISGNTQ